MRTQVRVRVLLEYPAGWCTEGVVTESQGPAFNGRPVWLPGGPRPVGDPPGGGVVRSLGPACSRARPRPARPAASVAALVRFRPSAASGGLGGWSAERSVAVAGPPPTDLAHAPSNPLACLFFPPQEGVEVQVRTHSTLSGGFYIWQRLTWSLV